MQSQRPASQKLTRWQTFNPDNTFNCYLTPNSFPKPSNVVITLEGYLLLLFQVLGKIHPFMQNSDNTNFGS